MKVIIILFILFSSASAADLEIVSKNCLPCHGAIVDGKKKIKGDLDLTAILRDGIKEKHTAEWVDIVKQVNSKNMPPDDSKYSLTDKQRSTIVNSVYSTLKNGEIPERILTPYEVINTYSKIFAMDREIYDPFEKLYFVKNLDARYPTIDSAGLMSLSTGLIAYWTIMSMINLSF